MWVGGEKLVEACLPVSLMMLDRFITYQHFRDENNIAVCIINHNVCKIVIFASNYKSINNKIFKKIMICI